MLMFADNGGDRLIFANYEKAYGIRGYEAKTLIIKKEIHPWPCNNTSGMGPTSRYPTKQESSISKYQQPKNRGRKQSSSLNTNPKTTALRTPKDVPCADKISRRVVKCSADT
jgi:hypothetical protein